MTQNTKITFTYQRQSTGKSHNQYAIVRGAIKNSYVPKFLDYLPRPGKFIPESVGIPCERFEDNYANFEEALVSIDEANFFELTDEPPTLDMHITQLLSAFRQAKRTNWEYTSVNDVTNQIRSRRHYILTNHVLVLNQITCEKLATLALNPVCTEFDILSELNANAVKSIAAAVLNKAGAITITLKNFRGSMYSTLTSADKPYEVKNINGFDVIYTKCEHIDVLSSLVPDLTDNDVQNMTCILYGSVDEDTAPVY